MAGSNFLLFIKPVVTLFAVLQGSLLPPSNTFSVFHPVSIPQVFICRNPDKNGVGIFQWIGDGVDR
jgi:hypothetical protein